MKYGSVALFSDGKFTDILPKILSGEAPLSELHPALTPGRFDVEPIDTLLRFGYNAVEEGQPGWAESLAVAGLASFQAIQVGGVERIRQEAAIAKDALLLVERFRHPDPEAVFDSLAPLLSIGSLKRASSGLDNDDLHSCILRAIVNVVPQLPAEKAVRWTGDLYSDLEEARYALPAYQAIIRVARQHGLNDHVMSATPLVLRSLATEGDSTASVFFELGSLLGDRPISWLSVARTIYMADETLWTAHKADLLHALRARGERMKTSLQTIQHLSEENIPRRVLILTDSHDTDDLPLQVTEDFVILPSAEEMCSNVADWTEGYLRRLFDTSEEESLFSKGRALGSRLFRLHQQTQNDNSLAGAWCGIVEGSSRFRRQAWQSFPLPVLHGWADAIFRDGELDAEDLYGAVYKMLEDAGREPSDLDEAIKALVDEWRRLYRLAIDQGKREDNGKPINVQGAITISDGPFHEEDLIFKIIGLLIETRDGPDLPFHRVRTKWLNTKGRTIGVKRPVNSEVSLKNEYVTPPGKPLRGDEKIFKFSGYFLFAWRDWLTKGSSSTADVERLLDELDGDEQVSEADAGDSLLDRLSLLAGAPIRFEPETDFECIARGLQKYLDDQGLPSPELKHISKRIDYYDELKAFIAGDRDVFLCGAVHARLIQRWWINLYKRAGMQSPLVQVLGPQDIQHVVVSNNTDDTFDWPPANVLMFEGRLKEPEFDYFRHCLTHLILLVGTAINQAARSPMDNDISTKLLSFFGHALSSAHVYTDRVASSFVTDLLDLTTVLSVDDQFLAAGDLPTREEQSVPAGQTAEDSAGKKKPAKIHQISNGEAA